MRVSFLVLTIVSVVATSSLWVLSHFYRWEMFQSGLGYDQYSSIGKGVIWIDLQPLTNAPWKFDGRILRYPQPEDPAPRLAETLSGRLLWSSGTSPFHFTLRLPIWILFCLLLSVCIASGRKLQRSKSGSFLLHEPAGQPRVFCTR